MAWINCITHLLSKNHIVLNSVVFIAELTLVFFAVIPIPYNVIFVFLNGLLLGMIWGLIFFYLEGRLHSEILGCGIALPFIVSSNIFKSIGKALFNTKISQWWMPATVGAIFFFPFIITIFVLESVPIQAQIQTTVTRFFLPFWSCLILWYIFKYLLIAFHEIRDKFALEKWSFELRILCRRSL